jgi:large subunit ribosomal protein L9e
MFHSYPILNGERKNKKRQIRYPIQNVASKKKRNAVLGTVRSIVRNMMSGVNTGYKFRMILAYNHFPIVVNVINNGQGI